MITPSAQLGTVPLFHVVALFHDPLVTEANNNSAVFTPRYNPEVANKSDCETPKRCAEAPINVD